MRDLPLFETAGVVIDTDFTAYRHPVVAVACPDCRARVGSFCRRPSGHAAADFHRSRKKQADEVFIRQHGQQAWIERLPDGGWRVHRRGYDERTHS